MVSLSQCRLCLCEPESEEENPLFPLDLEMTILELAGGGRVTVGDALKYINLDILVPFKSEDTVEDDEEEEEEKLEDEIKDHPEVPKSLCQICLDRLQSMYEFKYRCEENRDYLKNHVKELAEAREAAEKAARQAMVAELEFDISNIDALPDKLVLKPDINKKRRPRVKKDTPEVQQIKKKKLLEKANCIIAEDSQIETAIYVRKLITTPEKSSPDQKQSSKRKSKHVVIEDIAVGEKAKPQKYDRNVRKKEPLCDLGMNDSNNSEATLDDEESSVTITKNEKSEKATVKMMRDEEPVFEDDEEESKPKRPKRTRK